MAMTANDPRSAMETYAAPLFGFVLGLIGLLAGQLLMDGEAWPWFVGLITGLLIGVALSTRLRRQREARTPGAESEQSK